MEGKVHARDHIKWQIYAKVVVQLGKEMLYLGRNVINKLEDLISVLPEQGDEDLPISPVEYLGIFNTSYRCHLTRPVDPES